MRVLLEKVKEVLYSVLPVTVIVLILHFTITPLSTPLLLRFLLGAGFILVGLSILLFGVDIGISPLGGHVGASLSKRNKLWIIVAVGLVMGFFISVAEPDLQILAKQVEAVTSGWISYITLLIVVSAGIAAMFMLGMIRIVYNWPVHVLLTILYGVILVPAIFAEPEFLAIAFDASGATTGALTVPFILAVALGVSAMKKNSAVSESDSFGLVGITSTGAILGVMVMSLFRNVAGLSGSLPSHALDESVVLAPFMEVMPHITVESLLALTPVVVIMLVCQIFLFKLKRKPFQRMLKGMAYSLIGLILFLVGVNAGFMDVATVIGREVAGLHGKVISVGIGFLLGLVTILAEPAVHVLTDQIESVTSGYIKRAIVLVALSLGVGLAVAMSVLRIVVPAIQLWHYLLPGFAISIALSFWTPPLFVGIGFDSGGVASGPMTATFILAFMQGVASAVAGADVVRDAFGMIALVAMTPIITLQVLGLIVMVKSGKAHEVLSTKRTV